MTEPQVERRTALGVAVLSIKTPPVISTLQQAGIAYRALLVQEHGGLPKMRPPVVLDTIGMSPLDLARVLDNMAAGRVDGGKTVASLPTIAVADALAYAHHRLLACCPAIVAVMAAPGNPETLPLLVRWLGSSTADVRTGPLWYDLVKPPLPDPPPDLCGLLIALAGAAKLHDAAAAFNVSRATFFRRLDTVCDALALTRPQPGHQADRWLETLLNALNAPIERA
jgi:hypothetical protein